MLAVGKGHDVVAVAVPDMHRHPHLRERESPVLAEEDEVVDGRPQADPAAVQQVVEEHRAKLRPQQHPAVALRAQARVDIEGIAGERPHRPDEGGQRQRERKPHPGDELVQRAGQLDRAAGRGIRPDRRRDAADQTGGHHPVRHRVGAAENVRPPAGQPDHHEVVDAERVEQRLHVSREIPDAGVAMRGRRADAGPVDPDEAQVHLLRREPRRLRHLPPGTRSSVQPQHGPPAWVAELGETEPALSHRERALQARGGQYLFHAAIIGQLMPNETDLVTKRSNGVQSHSGGGHQVSEVDSGMRTLDPAGVEGVHAHVVPGDFGPQRPDGALLAGAVQRTDRRSTSASRSRR